MADATPRAPAGGAPLDRPGLIASVFAYLIWGGFPAYFALLREADALEIVLNRALWALPAIAFALFATGRLSAAFAQIARPRAMGALTLTALIIGGNWLIFVAAVLSGHVLQASLGYFINPLVSVGLGVALLGERLSRLGWIAVGLATVGVLNQALVVGQTPWFSLALAFSFASYGYLRKTAKVDAGPGLLAETIVLAPLALAGVIWLEATGRGHLGAGGLGLLLAGAGPLTVLPLFLFAFGARRLPLVLVGLLQYIAPSIQFAIGLAMGEHFTPAHGVTFALVWTGLAAFTYDAISQARDGRKERPRSRP
jgi:chloramphenicol-sensitive protein RarD